MRRLLKFPPCDITTILERALKIHIHPHDIITTTVTSTITSTATSAVAAVDDDPLNVRTRQQQAATQAVRDISDAGKVNTIVDMSVLHMSVMIVSIWLFHAQSWVSLLLMFDIMISLCSHVPLVNYLLMVFLNLIRFYVVVKQQQHQHDIHMHIHILILIHIRIHIHVNMIQQQQQQQQQNILMMVKVILIPFVH